MFEHSVKVPRHYKIAANIFKKVSTEGGSVKTLLYDDKLRHFRTNVLYALITETIKHAQDIDKIFDSCNILTTETRLDPWLAKILTAELLFGKKALPGNSKPEQTILAYKDKFEQYTAEHQDDLKSEVIRRPRYVRINTNLLTTSDAIREFQDLGFRFIRCTSGSYDDYLNQIQKLAEDEFTQDYHVKTVYVFAPGTKFHDVELCFENKIILQDKATTLAAHLLAPPSGSVVMDLCAAPGMKTTQLAAFMRNEGKIYAVERKEDRYKILCDFVEKSGCKCVETIHKDSLEIRRGDYDDVEYILLDPSCSGSGMELSVHNYIDEARLAKLTSLQEKFLKHAMNSFPKAKKIVYSTCSLFPEENERVVTNAVKVSRSKWRVQDVKELLKGQWNNFGSNMYGSIGMRCLYARPDTDLTTGFFLAVLERDQKEIVKQNSEKINEVNTTVKQNDVVDENNAKKKKNKRKNYEAVAEEMEQEYEVVEVQEEYSKEKRVKKNKNKNKTKTKESTNDEADPVEDEGVNKKKNKKKNKSKEIASEDPEQIQEDKTLEQVESEIRIKKKKNKAKDVDRDAVDDTGDNEVQEKKKTKNKHDLTDECEAQDQEELQKPKKKKKRKSKD